MVLQLDTRPGPGRLFLRPQRAVAGGFARSIGGGLTLAARAVSLIAAASTALVLTCVPFLVVHDLDARAHAFLSLLLLGMSAGFVHGLGGRPRAGIWRLAFSPWTAWPLLLSGWIGLLGRL